MATVTGTCGEIFGFTALGGPRTSSDSKEINGCFITATFTGTYASATNEAVITAVGAAIAAARRDGKTVRVISAAFAAPGVETSLLIGADTVTCNTTTITCRLTKADMTTEHDAAAMVAFQSGVVFWVNYLAS